MRKAIKGFPNYEIDEVGNIYSLARTIVSGKNHKCIRVVKERILKPSIDRYGYKKIVLTKNGKSYYFTVHRLVAINFISDPEAERNTVNHKDGNKLNNHVDNLEWMSHKENLQHAWDTGLKKPSVQKKGEENKKAKLTNKQAEEIRNSNLSLRKLGAIYGVHNKVISRIKKGISYKTEN